MPASKHYLSDEDVVILNEVIAAVKGERIGGGKHRAEDQAFSPECYVALPQADISARSGTTAGSGVCDIYYVDPDGELTAVSSFEQTVFNLRDSSLAAAEYIPVIRDKYGSWIALCTEPSS